MQMNDTEGQGPLSELSYQPQSVRMVCDGFEGVPQVALPAGYRFRAYRMGDDAVWMEIQRAAEPFFTIVDELFENEYGSHREALAERMWFVETDEGTPVGSISAWWESGSDVPNDRGRIHWVVIHPDHQRRALSKPMMTLAMNYMSQHHPGAVLGTSSGRPWAVKVYLDFGFLPDPPDLDDAETLQAWRDVQSVIDHPALVPFLN